MAAAGRVPPLRCAARRQNTGHVATKHNVNTAYLLVHWELNIRRGREDVTPAFTTVIESDTRDGVRQDLDITPSLPDKLCRDSVSK